MKTRHGLLVAFSVGLLASPLLAYGEMESEALTRIRGELDHLSGFSGVVLLAQGDRVIESRALGYADRQSQVSNTPGTKFNLGSMGKMFTGVAILQLVQSGKVGLNDSLGMHLPNYPNKDVSAVTIHQLLTHTGGVGDIFGPEFASQRDSLQTHSDYVKTFGKRGTTFLPGTKHEYSNYGYILLGRVIEVVSGISYEDYLQQYIFSVAQMRTATGLPWESIGELKAVPYSQWIEPGLVKSSLLVQPLSGTAAGGGYASAEDLLRFMRSLTSYRLLDPKYTELALSGKVDTPMRGSRYGYGFIESTRPDGTRMITQGGGSPGVNSRMILFPATGYVLVVLANLDPPAADRLAMVLGDRVAEIESGDRKP